ncbi:MAG: hypothetical protein V4625_12310 [Pseudomonadota bacterium]
MYSTSATAGQRPRLQQQPGRAIDRQQQQSSGSGEFQPRQQNSDARLSQAVESAYERSRSDRSGAEQQ